jgi:hypothetical protein
MFPKNDTNGTHLSLNHYLSNIIGDCSVTLKIISVTHALVLSLAERQGLAAVTQGIFDTVYGSLVEMAMISQAAYANLCRNSHGHYPGAEDIQCPD